MTLLSLTMCSLKSGLFYHSSRHLRSSGLDPLRNTIGKSCSRLYFLHKSTTVFRAAHRPDVSPDEDRSMDRLPNPRSALGFSLQVLRTLVGHLAPSPPTTSASAHGQGVPAPPVPPVSRAPARIFVNFVLEGDPVPGPDRPNSCRK